MSHTLAKDSPISVIFMATRSYRKFRIMMMTKLMQEAVTDVANCGVMRLPTYIQLIGGAVLHDAGKRRKHCQTVRNHTDYTGDNQRDLGLGVREVPVIHTQNSLAAVTITTQISIQK